MENEPKEPTITIPVRLYKLAIDLLPYIPDEITELPVPDMICDKCGLVSDEMMDTGKCPGYNCK